jgi:hypothetical protein
MTMNELKPSAFQNRVLQVPAGKDLFLGGGRGGGKSFAKVFLIIRHVETYGSAARILYLRRTYRGLADFENLLREAFFAVYGKAAKYNAQEHIWRFPNGAYLELAQMECEADYHKFQGRSFNLMFVDECQQYESPDLLDRLRSNLRGGKDTPTQMIIAANPGGLGHSWLVQRYLYKAAPWEPFKEENSGRTFVYCPSTYLDNEHIDQDEYEANLRASCPFDEELLKAWLSGDWNIARGAFFAQCLDQKNMIEPWQEIPVYYKGDKKLFWGDSQPYIAFDYGRDAPAVCLVMLKVRQGMEGPDGRFYPKGSYLVLDEFASNQPGSWEKGMGYSVDVLADRIKELCKTWDIRPEGVADDSIFARGGMASISDEFRRFGVYFREAQKGDRRTGWERLRRLMADAGKPDVPGLYIARHCEYLWNTLPYLPRDPKKLDDLDTRANDHGADALRYGIMDRKGKCIVKKVHGLM